MTTTTFEIEKKKQSDEILSELSQFTGTSQWYRFGSLLLTDGTKHLAELEPGHYWLLTLILSYQGYRKVKAMDFQLWTLKRNGCEAEVTCRPDTELPAVITQHIPFTDTPIEELKLFVRDGVLHLPSEY